ncbi:hypothetical protein [Ferribacterium limneticum]|nr:hypothetical protein [Ferribacterium limneticum]
MHTERDYSLPEEEDIREPVSLLKEPNCWEYDKIVPIVYFEVES